MDNGHLVAWSDSCSVTATAGTGSIVGSMTSGEVGRSASEAAELVSLSLTRGA